MNLLLLNLSYNYLLLNYLSYLCRRLMVGRSTLTRKMRVRILPAEKKFDKKCSLRLTW